MGLRPFAFGRNFNAALSFLLLLGALSLLLTGAATPVAYGALSIASQSSALATGCAATGVALTSSAGTGWPKQTEATLSATLSPSSGCGGLTVTWTTIQNNTGADYGWYCGTDWPTACASNKGVASTTSVTGDGTAGTTLGVASIGYNTGVKCVTLIAAISSPTLRGTLEPGWDYPANNYITGSLCAGETASKLVFTTQPGGAAAGSAFPPQPAVSAEDSIGNAVLNSTAGITLGIASGGSTLSSCSSNPVTATTGVATFASCTIGTAGTYTLNATSSGLTSATSSSFTMTATLNQTISFTAPGSGSVGGSATLSATGGASGNPVVFTVDGSSTSGACNVSGTNGTTVNYTAAGNCVIDANQAGNSTYNAAPQVQRTITVGARTDTISFSAGAGSGSAPSSISGADGSSVTLPSGSGLSDPGHSFAGWSDGATTYAAGASYTLSGSLTLTAQWTTTTNTDTISFSAGAGSGSVPSSMSGADGTSITLPSGSGLSDPGHSFAGWSDGTTTYAAGASYTLSGSLTLTAQWTTTTPSTDTIVFSAGTGSGSVPSISGADGSSITLPSGSGLSKPGFTFAGWSDGTTTYAAGGSYTLSSSLTLTAQWTTTTPSTDTIAFSAGAGSGSVASMSGADGSSITLPSGSGLSKPGFTFAGWSDGTTTYAAGATYALSGSLTLTAQWTTTTPSTDTIAFSAGAGSGSVPSSISGADGSSVTLPSGSGLSDPGHSFAGWSDGTTTYAAGASYTLSGSLTLTAQWTTTTPSTDTIAFSAGAGSGSVASMSGADGSSITLPSGSGLSKPGFTFAGWSDGTTTFAAGATYALSGSLTLTAQWTANSTDTISFSAGAGSGSVPSSISGADGSSVTLPSGSGLSDPGHSFAGWSDGTTTYAAGASYTLSGSLTLTAQWTTTTPSTDTIVFSAGAGSGTVPSSISGADGTSITLPSGSGLSDPGHSFAGWSDGTTTYAAGASYALSGSLTLTAQWTTTTSTDTISFSAGGGSGSAPSSISGADGTSITLPAGSGLSDPGHSFAGWSDGTTTYAAGATYALSGSLTLTAQWTTTTTTSIDTISFSAGAGSGSVPSSISGADGSSVTLPSGSGLSDPGHSFASWSDGTTTYAAGASYTLSGSLTLTAQWTTNTSTDTITFSAGAGSGSVPSSISGADGTSITLPAGSGLSDPGHSFASWSDGTTTYAAGASYTLSGSLTLTAQWTTTTSTDTITFSAGGGSGSVPSSISGADGSSITLPSGSGLSRLGFTFAGWSDGTTTYAAGASYTLTGSLTLTAQWTTTTSTDTISFSAGAGSGSVPSSISGADGTSITLPSGSGLSDPGHNFAGWSDGTTTYAAGATYTLTGSLTLTAQWTTTTSTDTISFSAGAGSGSVPSSISGADGTSITLPSGSRLSDPGHSFAGWSDGTTTYAAGASYTLSGSLTLTAQWTTTTTSSTDTITFNSEGGTSVAPIRGRSGSTVSLPAGPSRVGYIFIEWFTSPTGGNRVGSPYALSGSVTLYAQWQRVSEVPTGAGEIMSKGGKVTKVPIRASHGEVTIGTADYGLRIKTSGTSTTFANATITLVRGSNVTLSGYGFKPGTIVRIYLFSNPTLIGVARVRRDGTYSGRYRVPPGLTDGRHSIESLGTIYNGTSRGVAAPVWVTSRTTTIVIDPFDFNSATLTSRLKAEVAKAARIIRKYRVRSLTFTGYTDPRGSTSINLALSRRRGSAVASYLVSELHAMHYLMKNVQLLGLGKTHLVFAANGTVKNRASRRVVITLRTG